ncbi:RagB/SusD family nutrient uptake outer membrane protein [Flagellimonas flava]|uniref:Starch-binding associating with outer membrane n=1 Tax=Flagellimonas flava TaxID=570519 RepID=A0A1M5NMF0_9FLAO|nr:RagB/SusD family nutrient uptake outer membrane protein [Allomuricauda flava]SHG90379.1 Starch-binding associating with outer membrane [Allomuricauda flava]
MRKIMILAILIVLSSACSDFLEEEPKDFLSPDNFPNTQNDVIQLIGGVQTRFGRNDYYDRDLWDVVGYGADHVTSRFLPGNIRGDMEHYTFLTDNPRILSLWETNYFGINAMNQILQALEGRDEGWIPGYRGAALSFRALFYFHLVQLFGDLPIVTEPISDLGSGLEVGRSPVAEVYALIENDLLEAESLLEGVDFGRPGLPTVGFAKTLLANVYLTMAGFPLEDDSKWALAAAKAKEVKASGTYSLVRPFSDLWLIANENGPEHIFSTQRDMAESSLQAFFPARTRPNFIGYQSGTSNYNGDWGLYNKYSDEDLRRSASFDTIIVSTETASVDSPVRIWNYTEFNGGTNPKETRPYSLKYFDSGRPYNEFRNFGRRQPTNFPIYRYAEVLLFIAEADNEANNGPTQDAYDAINEVRDRAGLAPLSGLGQDEFRDAVRLERELELNFELKRRFDLVRYGIFYEVMSQEEFAEDGIQPHHVLYPIPANELSVNPSLEQNPGY